MEDTRTCPVCSGSMQFFREEHIAHEWTIQYLICQNCGLIHSFNHSFFDTVLYSEHYFEDVDSGWKERGDEIFAVFDRHFHNKKPLRVLDIGSGKNYFVSRLVEAGYDAYGVDAYSEPIFAIDRFYRDFGSLPYISFDVVVLLEVVEHLISPVKELEGFLKYLNPDGKIFLTTVIYRKRSLTPVEWFINPQYGHVTIWSMGAMSSIFSKFGFKNAHIYRFGNLQIWDRTPGSLINNWFIQSNISTARTVLGRIRFRVEVRLHDLF